MTCMILNYSRKNTEKHKKITWVLQMEPTAVNKDPDILQGDPAGNKAVGSQ